MKLRVLVGPSVVVLAWTLAACTGPDLPEVTRAGVLTADDLPAEPESGSQADGLTNFQAATTGSCPFGAFSGLEAPTFDPDSQAVVYEGVEGNTVASAAFRGTTAEAESGMGALVDDLAECSDRAPDDVDPLDLGDGRVGWSVPRTSGGRAGATAVARVDRTVVAVSVFADDEAGLLDVEPLLDKAVERAEQG